MRRAIAFAFMVLLAACRRDPSGRAATTESTTMPPVPPTPPTFPNPTPEQLGRKARSEARLGHQGVPVLASLPVIESEGQAKMRTRDAAVDRAIALMIVAVKGEGLEQELVDKVRASYSADPFFSPKEKTFVLDRSPSHEDRAQFAWRYECVGVLHWALGYVAKLETPSQIVDAGEMVRIVKNAGPKKYREGATLRSAGEILDEADLIYRYDWACVNARVSEGKPPPGIDCEIVVERHHALNWLIGYQDQAWDDVSTDT